MRENTSGSEKLFREKLVYGGQENKSNWKGRHSSLKVLVGLLGHSKTGPHTSGLYLESAVIWNIMVSSLENSMHRIYLTQGNLSWKASTEELEMS